MVVITNKTNRQRVYTLANGVTLRVAPLGKSEQIKDELVNTGIIKSDAKAGVIDIASVSYENKDAKKSNEGGKK